jgi:hypothetical protein
LSKDLVKAQRFIVRRGQVIYLTKVSEHLGETVQSLRKHIEEKNEFDVFGSRVSFNYSYSERDGRWILTSNKGLGNNAGRFLKKNCVVGQIVDIDIEITDLYKNGFIFKTSDTKTGEMIPLVYDL